METDKLWPVQNSYNISFFGIYSGIKDLDAKSDTIYSIWCLKRDNTFTLVNRSSLAM